PHGHLAAFEREEFFAPGLDEVVGLVAVIKAIKLADRGPGIGLVIPKLFLLFFGVSRLEITGRGGFGVTFLEEIFPFFEVVQGLRRFVHKSLALIPPRNLSTSPGWFSQV